MRIARWQALAGDLRHAARGDPESSLRWTCKSVRRLAGHSVSYPVVAELLHELDYSLQANRKTKEGDSHPDRNAQFEHINTRVQQYLGRKQPVISVDTKKKELTHSPSIWWSCDVWQKFAVKLIAPKADLRHLCIGGKRCPSKDSSPRSSASRRNSSAGGNEFR
jgi:hypothetical protein